MRVLTKIQCARDAGFSVRTLERAIERGEGPPVIQISERRVGVLESDFSAWLLARRRMPPGFAAVTEPVKRGRGRPRKVVADCGAA